VDLAGDELLARARLAEDEHGCRALDDRGQVAKRTAKGRARADELRGLRSDRALALGSMLCSLLVLLLDLAGPLEAVAVRDDHEGPPFVGAG
jgi:hypothetical protein